MHEVQTRDAEAVAASTEAESDRGPTESGSVEATADHSDVTRRSFLRATGGAAVAAGGAAAASDGVAAQSRTYRFGGHVPGWEGRAPESISGETNPTLQLQAGTEYEVVWENLDGVIHNFVIQSEGGQELASTEDVTQEGATASVTFTATADMAQYVCVYHQSTMVGDIEVEGGSQAAGGNGAGEGGIADGGVPLELAAVVGSVLVLFLSPLLFALFLFTRNRTREGEGGAPNR